MPHLALLSSPFAKNISVFQKRKSVVYPAPSRLDQRGVAHRHDVEAGCNGRGFALSTMAPACGRRRRVVLTPRRWRQVGDDAFASRLRRWQESPVTGESAL